MGKVPEIVWVCTALNLWIAALAGGFMLIMKWSNKR